MTNPQLYPGPPESPAWIALRLLLLAAALIGLGPLTVCGAAWLFRLRPDRSQPRRLLLLGFGAVLGLLLLGLFAPAFFAALSALFAAGNGLTAAQRLLRLGILWLVTLPLIPLGAVLIAGFEAMKKLFAPPTVDEYLRRERAYAAEREQRLRERAAMKVGKVAPLPRNVLRLGPVISGEQFPAYTGIVRAGGHLGLHEDVLDKHCFILGTTGAGKSEAIKRLCREILEKTDRDLYLVDGKGEASLASAIRDLAYAYGRGEAPVFRLGQNEGGAIYDGFRGSPQDLYSRLAALVGVAEMEGDSRVYADMMRRLLQLICYAPVGPPRAFEELELRLDTDWLLHAWRDHPAQYRRVQRLRPKELESLAYRLDPLIFEFAPLVGPEGFALEETRAAIFSLRTQSAGDTARRLLDFLIEDLKDFVGKRQRRPAVLIIDEFSRFGNRSSVDLLSLARSSRLAVVLATQDTSGLGDPDTRQQILALCGTKLLMTTDFPEEVGSLAGTRFEIENSLKHERGQATGEGTARAQHTFKVDPNAAAQLQVGEGFLIRQRFACKLRIERVEPVPPAPPEGIALRGAQRGGAPDQESASSAIEAEYRVRVARRESARREPRRDAPGPADERPPEHALPHADRRQLPPRAKPRVLDLFGPDGKP